VQYATHDRRVPTCQTSSTQPTCQIAQGSGD
jgi:hypothetical protein